MKNVIFFSGNHLRHKFIADKKYKQIVKYNKKFNYQPVNRKAFYIS